MIRTGTISLIWAVIAIQRKIDAKNKPQIVKQSTAAQSAADSRQRSVLIWSRLCEVGPTTKTRGRRCCVVECFFRVESVDSVGPSLDCFTQKATDNPGQLKSIVMFWLALQRLSILQWSALWHLFSRPCIFDARLKMKTIHVLRTRNVLNFDSFYFNTSLHCRRSMSNTWWNFFHFLPIIKFIDCGSLDSLFDTTNAINSSLYAFIQPPGGSCYFSRFI